MAKGTRYDHRLDFAYLIAIEREDQGLTQTEVAASVGVSQTVYNHWERGIHLPTFKAAAAIGKKLGLDLSKLDRIHKRAAVDWKRLGGPNVTRAYETPGGTTTDVYRVKGGR